ncbi:hypothetical protein B0H16DRAFT_1460541 [Mycena metata]|uniref:F-box domain-containing protein n=1 Tax=Mycena metata TaxID=1033252 RepID=A0AAD7N841_9AGAR|nr:hypothetical protein B0H16DRAFT_1460541 [Mycena metata]
MEHLPLELIDLIIDQLPLRDDWKRLALVSRIFLAPTQRRLFVSLELSPSSLEKRSNILFHSPALGRYIHDFSLDLNLEDREVHGPLIRVLRPLTAVRRVTIFGDWYWPHWPRELQKSLTAVLMLPSMRCLGLRCVGVPAALIRYALSSYAEVALQVTQIDHLNRRHKFAKGGGGQSLERLVLASSSPRCTSVHTLMLNAEVMASLGCLQHLELILLQPEEAFMLPNQEGWLDGFDDIFMNCSTSLQYLTIALEQPWAPGRLDFTLPPTLRHLSSLNIQARLSRPDFLPFICSVIIRLPSYTPGLEFLTVTLDELMFVSRVARDGDRETDVDDALLQLPNFQQICFNLWPFSCGAEPGIRKMLSRANKAGLVSFDFSGRQMKRDWTWKWQDAPMMYFSQ